MSYRIAGIDVHKKMLAVVGLTWKLKASTSLSGGMFGSSRTTAIAGAWLLEQEAEK